jgi:MFS transporter, NNP family, nitrate/nitrite transporter
MLLFRGGATFAIMVSLYSSLRSDDLSQHTAWRAAFAIVPCVTFTLTGFLTNSMITRVPILLTVAALTLFFGQDHPAGSWSQRHTMPATAIAMRQGHELHLDSNEKVGFMKDEKNLEASVIVRDVTVSNAELDLFAQSPVDLAVNESLTRKTAVKICFNPLTWLPAFAYLTTFGLELAIDGQMANILFALFNKRIHGFDQRKAGYYTSVLWENLSTFCCVILNLDFSGFLNLVTRPFGGFMGDCTYRWFGTKGKKYWMLFCGLVMGATFLAGGLYLDNHPNAPHRQSFIFMFIPTIHNDIFSADTDGHLCRFGHFLGIREWRQFFLGTTL